MTIEEKELLKKDICARLPYHLKVNYADKVYDIMGYMNNNLIILLPFMSNMESHPIETCKPYLRQMSSKTEKETAQFLDTCIYVRSELYYEWTCDSYDWLDAHHFDYRGLIEKGLALEAPEEMYNDEN